MNIQWYPGHMTKARRMMEENIKLVDLIIEILDARIPYSSRNPDIGEMGKQKARIILLNKSDLADPSSNEKWAEYYKAQGASVLFCDARSAVTLKQLQGLVKQACQEKIERDRKKGIINRPLRAMVAGIPNVGKSTFINSFAGKAVAQTGNKPGVTRGKQWIRIRQELELLDTPGILWPRFDDQAVGLRLALSGSVKDEVVSEDDLCEYLLGLMTTRYPGMIAERYGIDENGTLAEVLTAVAKARGCLLKAGEPDLSRAAKLMIDDFRSGRLGKITLELPTDIPEKQDKKEKK